MNACICELCRLAFYKHRSHCLGGTQNEDRTLWLCLNEDSICRQRSQTVSIQSQKTQEQSQFCFSFG